MAGSSTNSQALIPYVGEISNCERQIILYSHSIEAQTLLAKKLREHCKRQKEICNFMKNANTLLENEIKVDEQRKESLLVALESIKARNVELNKELLLAKSNRQNMIEKGNHNIKKYEEHWIICKKRFESIPFIQKYLLLNNEIETVTEKINVLIYEAKNMCAYITMKKNELLKLDKQYIIELADYMINKRPLIIKCIQEKNNKLKDLEYKMEINKISMGHQQKKFGLPVAGITTIINEDQTMENIETLSKNKNNDDTMVLPKLQLQRMDLDIAPIKFLQTDKLQSAALIKRTDSALKTNKVFKNVKIDEKTSEVHISPYFKSPTIMDDNNESKNQNKKYSKKKLIHILEDVKLDVPETYKMISKLKTNQFHNVNVIKNEVLEKDVKDNERSEDKVVREIEDEMIEEIDLTKTNSKDILIPPTPFMDLTQSSQEKRVTFNSVITIQNSTNFMIDNTNPQDDNTVNDSLQLNASTASDDSYKKIQDFVFQKRKLNLSPEFTYTKNSALPKWAEEKIVTSNNFNKNNSDRNIENIVSTDRQVDKPNNIHEVGQEKTIQDKTAFEVQECTQKAEGDTVNYLQGISKPLNISMNTTGCEDTDGDYPQYIDSSLLLSPKADDEMPASVNKVEVMSQEVPNFLTGLRKTAFSFFESKPKNKPESEKENESNNFKFTFGSDEKKRGVLFNMFN